MWYSDTRIVYRDLRSRINGILNGYVMHPPLLRVRSVVKADDASRNHGLALSLDQSEVLTLYDHYSYIFAIVERSGRSLRTQKKNSSQITNRPTHTNQIESRSGFLWSRGSKVALKFIDGALRKLPGNWFCEGTKHRKSSMELYRPPVNNMGESK